MNRVEGPSATAFGPMAFPFYTRSMSRRFRTALMWLLLLALPLQGFAAATMIHCGPNHHRMSMAPVGAATGSHQHATSGHRSHEAGDRRAVQSDLGSDEQSEPSVHHLDKLSKVKCSACAACCIGAALPTTALAIASIPPAVTTVVFVVTPHADFVADGLDPPPRPLLA